MGNFYCNFVQIVLFPAAIVAFRRWLAQHDGLGSDGKTPHSIVLCGLYLVKGAPGR